MAITIDDIKALRARTQAGVMDCRTALTETNGDLEKAVALLQQKGLATAAQRADRETSQGLVEAYVHSGRLGALVELKLRKRTSWRAPRSSGNWPMTSPCR